MDSFTQNMILRTKQRQAMLSKTKTGTIENMPSDEKKQGEKMNAVDPSSKENVILNVKKQESPNRVKEFSNNFDSKKSHSPLSETKNLNSPLSDAKKLNSPLSDAKKQSSPSYRIKKSSSPTLVVGATRKFSAAVTTPRSVLTPEKKLSNTSLQKNINTQSKSPLSKSQQPLSECSAVEVVLEKPILKSLETQGFTPSNSRSRLIYQFAKEMAERDEDDAAWATKHTLSPRKTDSIKDRPGHERKPTNSLAIAATTSSSALRTSQHCTPKKTFNATPKKFSPSSMVTKTPNFSKVASPKRFSPSAPSSKTLDRPKPTTTTPARQFSASALNKRTPDRSQNSLSSRIAQFESQAPPKKDPCEMTLSERKKFFESSAQQATPSKTYFTPKATSVHKIFSHVPEDKPVQINTLSNISTTPKVKECLNDRSDMLSSDLTRKQDAEKEDKDEELFDKKINKFFSPVKALVESPSKLLPIPQTIPEEKPIPSIMVSGVNEELTKIRPIRVSPPKPGRLYPNLSDIEISTTESESDYPEQNNSTLTEEKDDVKNTSGGLDLDSSFAVDILGKAGLMEFVNTPKRKYPMLQQQIQEQRLASTLNFDKEEFAGHAASAKNDSEEISLGECSNKEGLEESRSENEPRLFHSISFYRKQQQELIVTPRKEPVKVEVESKRNVHPKQKSSSVPLEQMIRSLQDEMKAQEIVMAQASQALNFCRSTAEFSGSTEQVEGEKLLLIATQKRHAACSEISRLRAQVNANTDSEQHISKGNLSISDVKLPLKKEFISLLSKGGDDFVHYFIIMIRHQGQIIPLQMLSTLDGVTDGALRFPNLIQLRDLPPTFQLAIEVYALQTRKEKLEHEVKYHIKKDNNKLRLTPRKSESKLHSRTPKTNSHQAPSLRSSSFGLVGFCEISQSTLKQSIYNLDKMPAASPISGQLHIKIQCHADVSVDERGFLTVFEDVGGYGAWHRRWCLLSNDGLHFWKYPDEEKIKSPMAHVNLRKCVTEKVDVVPHDVCARPHTFLLVTVRPPKEGDRDSLVMTTAPEQTLIKNLLSADTKEERIRWCSLLNKILSNLRTWDVDSSS